MKTHFTFLFVILQTVSGSGQTPVLDAYLARGLEQNKSLRQASLLKERELFANREAISLFFPTVTAGGDYLDASGGRSITFPVGDLMNPVYSALNQMTGTQSFPAIQNQEFQLNPENYYDARVRVSVPLVNTDIWYNHQIRSGMLDLQIAEENLVRLAVSALIKTRYFQAIQAREAVKIVEKGVGTARENLRITEKLKENGLAAASALSRSRSEVSRLETLLQEQQILAETARAQFNQTVGLASETPLETDSLVVAERLNFPEPESLQQPREEIKKLEASVRIRNSENSLNSAFWIPKVAAFADIGSQGTDWKFNESTRYTQVGLTLSWSLNTGLGDYWKIRQSSSGVEAARLQLADFAEQLQIESDAIRKNYLLSLKQYQSRKSEKLAASEYYREISLKYQTGNALFIELLDAQNQLISAGLQQNIAYYQVLIRLADYRRITGKLSSF